MRPQVDALAQRIVSGDREWRFQVDCREDSVSLELNGTVYRVRPLRWREKRALARFVSLGEEFLKREFVRVSLADPDREPAKAEETDVLFELARWFNTPESGDLLPFDAPVLAKVTFDLCRAMGLAPKDFDQRDASEVELLWTAAQGAGGEEQQEESREAVSFRGLTRGSSTAERLVPSESTRILIVPDPPVSVREESAKAEKIEESGGTSEPLEAIEPVSASAVAGGWQPRADRFRVSAFPHDGVNRLGAEIPGRRPAPKGTTDGLRDSVVATVAETLLATLPQAVCEANVTEKIETSDGTSEPLEAIEPVSASAVAGGWQLRADRFRVSAFSHDGANCVGAEIPGRRPAPQGTTSCLGDSVVAIVAEAPWDSRALLATLPQAVREAHITPPVDVVRRQTEPAFEDFAEQLTEAAAQLGIDVER
jgi:hypothetical protein